MCVSQPLFYQPEASRHHSNLGLTISKNVLGGEVRSGLGNVVRIRELLRLVCRAERFLGNRM